MCEIGGLYTLEVIVKCLKCLKLLLFKTCNSPYILCTRHLKHLNGWSPSIYDYWTAKDNLFELQLLRLIFVSFTAFYEIDKLFSLFMNKIEFFFSQNMNEKY